MKMKRFIIQFLILLIVLILPFFIVEIAIINMKPVYHDTYSAALIDKVKLLDNTNEQKIILVGGSSLPFGIDSELIEEHIHTKVVNFGMYAKLGTKLMLELSKRNINSEDIVLIAPEINEQTYSLYFNPQATLEAIEDDFSIIHDLQIQDRMKLFYNSYKFGLNKLNVASYSDHGNGLEAPYVRTAFNSYGDIKTERPYNIMPTYYDKSMMITINNNLINQDFMNYLNDYIEFCRKKGAYVFFSFSPMNNLAITETSELAYQSFNKKLDKEINCDILGSVEEFIYDSKYFYDTNYHLNDTGSILHTKHIIELIKEKFNIKTDTNILVPEPPLRPGEEVIDGDNTYRDYFEYTLIGSNYYITKIKDEYKDVKKIIIPSTLNDLPILGINSYAFKDCKNLEEIHIYTNIRIVEENMFEGCSSLTKIYVYATSPRELFVPATDLLTGANENCKIYIQQDYLRRFQSDYTWSVYGYYLNGF